MYGLIHRAIRHLVTEQAGPAAWEAMERQLEISPADMITAVSYPDEQTAAMLSASAQQFGEDVPQCLRRFGRHWLSFAENSGYSAMMDFVAHDLPDFIANLDRMHQAVKVALPDARVPEFTLVSASKHQLRVLYRSERKGMEPMVAGLLEGLITRFGLTGTVSQLPEGDAGAEFLIDLPVPSGHD